MALIIDSIELNDEGTDPTVDGQMKMVNGKMKRKRGGLVTISVDCVGGVTDPTATHDSSSGYTTGMIWVNTANKTVWDLVDDTPTAAVWKRSTLEIFSGAGDTGSVPDPVTETGKFLKDDGTWATPAGSGDMLAATYDPTSINADAFARANHTGTQTASTISDFDTEVGNHTDVAANTTDRHAHPIADTTALVKGSVDATKLVRIEADGLTTATTRVITMPDKDVTIDDQGDARPPTAHTHTASDITDFDTEVGNHTDVAANTTDRHTHGNTTALNAVLGVNTGDEPDASTTVKGIVELATDGENAANVVVQGNDSRLSDDRTADGIRTATTVVAVSSATAPTAGQVLTATSGTAADWQTPAGGGGDPTATSTTPAVTVINTSSPTPVVMTGVEVLSLAAGNYLVFFGASIAHDTNNGSANVYVYVDGSAATGSTQTVTYPRAPTETSVSVSGFPVTVSASGSVKIFWDTTTGTASARNPYLTVLKVA